MTGIESMKWCPRSSSRISLRVVFVLGLLACLQGCVLAPLIQSYKQIGVSESDRQQLLQDSVKDFQRALYWGQAGEAVALTEEASQEELRKLIRTSRKSEKIVESKVDYVEFGDESMDAEVEVVVKYYKVPFYVVNERTERQKWNFSYSSGWKYVSREIVDNGSTTS